MSAFRLEGLVAALHTPFDAAGALHLPAVERQASHLLEKGIHTAFIAGSTGESHGLTTPERLALAERWADVTRGTALRLVVHVGSNSIEDAKQLASHAGKLGVSAISALAPSYYRPATLDSLIACCATLAAEAPETPFYFYDIPVLTRVQFSMPEFLERGAARIPTLAGIKFTNADMMEYLMTLRACDGRFDVPWGVDEAMLAALATGAKGAVGSSYNFAAPIYQRMMAAFAQGDLATAREEQYRSIQLIKTLASYGYLAAAKATMAMLGVDVGGVRLPLDNLTDDRKAALRADLERIGVFDWI